MDQASVDVIPSEPGEAERVRESCLNKINKRL